MLALMATVIVLFALGGITVFADETDESQPEIVASGYCGAEGNEENVSWTLDSNGLLTISGTGEMKDFDSITSVPWFGKKKGIKEVNISEGVTSIGELSFFECTSLTSIVISDSVTSIGDSSFSGCTSLASIDIPDSVTSIGNGAFSSCTSLASIDIPDSVTSIGYLTFCACYSLTSITIPDSVTSIGVQAFRGCRSLTSITLPDSVTSIGGEAFSCCKSLTSITLPDSKISIGDLAFYECSNLNSVVLNRNSWTKRAFDGCSENIFHYYYNVNYSNSENGTVTGKQRSFGGDVVEFTVTPDSNYVIDKVTLSYAGKTVEITPDANGKYKYTMPDTDSATISATFKAYEIIASGFCGAEGNGDNISWTLDSNGTLTIFGEGDMTNYTQNDPHASSAPWNNYQDDITSVVLTDGVTSIGNSSFVNFDNLTSVEIPDSVTSIGNSAFENCDNLEYIAIPDNVNSIDDRAFSWCTSLVEITIPDNVTRIENGTFEGCENLSSVIIPNSVTYIGSCAFMYCTSLTSIELPEKIKVINNYTFCECWSLTTIVIPEGVTSIGFDAFCNCLDLSDVVIPDSVTKIDSVAFCRCPKLTRIIFPDNETSIGFNAFSDCQRLSYIVLNKSAYNENAFPNCSESVFHYYYDVNYSNSENGTVTGKQRSFGGDVVEFTVTPDSNYVIDKITLSYAGKTVEITPDANGKYKYTMPDTDSATISATFKADETLKIETEPVDFTGVIGEYATFTVVATGSDLKYQWQVFKNGAWTNCSVNDGAKTDTLTLEAKDSRDGTTYQCVVTDKSGNKVTTKIVTLTVSNPLEIKIQPKDCSGYAGETTTFTVKANGSGLKYQWQVLKNGTWTNCSINDGAKTNKLTLEIKDSRNGCKYQCVVTDKNGDTVTTNEATLTVNKPLSINQQPANVSGAEGETATFTVVAEGTGLKYQWQVYKNGAWTNCSVNDGAKTATLSLEIKSSRDGLKYQCVVTDKTGASVTSNEATLSLAKELTIVSEPETYVLAFEGYNAVFTIEAQGDGLKYQWQVLKNGTWTNCSINDGAKTNKLTLEAKQSRFGLQYHCIVSDKYGNEVTSKVSTLYVYDRPGTRSASDIAPATSEADVDIIEASDYVENADTVEITDFTEDTVEVVDVVEVSEVVEVTEVIEVTEAIETIPEVESDTAAVD